MTLRLSDAVIAVEVSESDMSNRTGEGVLWHLINAEYQEATRAGILKFGLDDGMRGGLSDRQYWIPTRATRKRLRDLVSPEQLQKWTDHGYYVHEVTLHDTLVEIPRRRESNAQYEEGMAQHLRNPWQGSRGEGNFFEDVEMGDMVGKLATDRVE